LRKEGNRLISFKRGRGPREESGEGKGGSVEGTKRTSWKNKMTHVKKKRGGEKHRGGKGRGGGGGRGKKRRDRP